MVVDSDMGIHDEAKIWSFQNFQALDNSYQTENKVS